MSGFEPIKELMPRPTRKRRASGRSPDEAELNPSEELVLELVRVGVGLRKARHLVDSFPPEQIARQLKWLPLRRPRRPASLLITAIEANYDPPAYAPE